MIHVLSRAAKLITLLLFSALAVTTTTAHAQSTLPLAFTILGPEGIVARVITAESACPDITIDGATSPMQLRAAADADYPVTVCDAHVPVTAASASVLDRELKLLTARPERIVSLGDTGCRMKGTNMQSCNDPAAWPWAQVADSAAATNPQLVIHVGDYHYRESPCDPTKANCDGSPYGFNWASWDADFFSPGRNLLQAAPWVMVRGNHEDCSRAWDGYFRFIDPLPRPDSCPIYTEPYAIEYMEPRLLVLDNSAVNDYEVQPDQLAAYTPLLQKMNDLAGDYAWWLQHDPMYAFGPAGTQDGIQQLFTDQPTLQQAGNNTYSPGVQTFISGHLHSFEVLSFGPGRPPQLLVGNGGTLLDAGITESLVGKEIAGMPVEHAVYYVKFGFTTMHRAGDQWALGIKDVNGIDFDRCLLGDHRILCGQPALPATGMDLSGTNLTWLILGVIGGSLLLIGAFLILRRPKTSSPQ